LPASSWLPGLPALPCLLDPSWLPALLWCPVPPWLPAPPALPQYPVPPLPHGLGPPSLPLFHLHSTSLLIEECSCCC
ncbi:hypothetical protein M9458_043650, partial [Cirrhinus mrigala]